MSRPLGPPGEDGGARRGAEPYREDVGSRGGIGSWEDAEAGAGAGPWEDDGTGLPDDSGAGIGVRADELEQELREAAALLDPVPSELVQAAVDAFMTRTLDDELAALSFDSLADAGTVRGDAEPRVAAFHAGRAGVDVEIVVSGAVARIIGQVIPPRAAEIEVRGRRQVTVTADAMGRFSCDQVAAGPFSLRCRFGDLTLVTEWITI
ncbi:hypothetical protein [Sphaerisporangium aureirubrum]|uniref:Carboxypeptidase regulatory-like domain-containing protein n=1 Tax=Sphaerisporangium aureirubrum TaxID=1544736 RepID=A0ABW1NNE0_9ACTN